MNSKMFILLWVNYKRTQMNLFEFISLSQNLNLEIKARCNLINFEGWKQNLLNLIKFRNGLNLI
jgi:hypothetical protein